MPSPRSAKFGRERSYFSEASIRRLTAPDSQQNPKGVALTRRSPRTAAESERQRNELPNTTRLRATPTEAAASAKFHADLDLVLQKLEHKITTQFAGLQAALTLSFQDIVGVCSQLLHHRETMSEHMKAIETLVKEAVVQQHDMLAVQTKDMSSTPPVFLEKPSTGLVASHKHIESIEIKDTEQSPRSAHNPCPNKYGVEIDHLPLATEPLAADNVMAVGTLPVVGIHQVSSKLTLEEFVALDIFPTGRICWNLDQLDRTTIRRLSQGIEGYDGLPLFQEVIAKARVQEQDEAFKHDLKDINRLLAESAEVVEKATARDNSVSAEASRKLHARENSAQPEIVGTFVSPSDADASPRQKSDFKSRLGIPPSEDEFVAATNVPAPVESESNNGSISSLAKKMDDMALQPKSFRATQTKPSFKRSQSSVIQSVPSDPSSWERSKGAIDFEGSTNVSKYMFRDELNQSISVEAALDAVANGSEKLLYKHDHSATKLLFNRRFIQLNLFVIFLNAIYVGLEAHFNPTGNSLYASHVAFMFASNVFCIFFVLEWCFQFAAYSNRNVILTRLSPFADTILVFLTVLDTWLIEPLLYTYDVSFEISPLKVLGILSFARVARFVGAIPELLTLMRGIVMATKAVFWSLTMVLVFTCIFAVILVTLLQSDDGINTQMGPRNFQDLRRACFVLLYDAGLLEEFGTKMTILSDAYTPRATLASVTMIIYMFIINLTILNLLTGAMLEVVKSLTAETQDEYAVKLMKQTILKQLVRFEDGDGLVSRAELTSVLDDEEADHVFRSLNVDRVFLMEMQDLLFLNDQSQVSVAAFTEMLLLCRGDNVVTVQIMANGLLYVSSLLYKMEKQIHEQMACLQRSLPKPIQSCSVRSCPEVVMQTGMPSMTDLRLSGNAVSADVSV